MNDIKDLKICGIIVAKENSNRFPGKNYAIKDGKPLFWHNVELLKEYINHNDIFIATDSKLIKEYSEFNNIKIIHRGHNVTRDEEPFFNVLKFAYQSIPEKYDLIISIAANAVDIEHRAIGRGIYLMMKHHDISEIRSFDESGMQSGIFLFRNSIFEKDCMVLNAMAAIKSNGGEIHFKEELK